MKNYYKVGYGNPCPSDILPTVLLYEPATKILWEHCGFCRRSWKFTGYMQPVTRERIAEIDSRPALWEKWDYLSEWCRTNKLGKYADMNKPRSNATSIKILESIKSLTAELSAIGIDISGLDSNGQV